MRLLGDIMHFLFGGYVCSCSCHDILPEAGCFEQKSSGRGDEDTPLSLSTQEAEVGGAL